jgi:hypothetical protein
MQFPTRDQVREKASNAPEHLLEFIRSDLMRSVFEELRTKHKLHIDQAGNMATAINSIVLGIRNLDEFPAMLKEALGNSDNAMQEDILKIVNEKIFVLLRTLTKGMTTPVTAAEKPLSAPAAVTTPVLPPSPIQQIQKAPLVTQLEPMPVPAPVVPPPAPMVVAENKMTMTSAPTPVTTSVPMPPPAPTTAITPPTPKEPKPEAPVKYHGTDPYREPFE